MSEEDKAKAERKAKEEADEKARLAEEEEKKRKKAAERPHSEDAVPTMLSEFTELKEHLGWQPKGKRQNEEPHPEPEDNEEPDDKNKSKGFFDSFTDWWGAL